MSHIQRSKLSDEPDLVRLRHAEKLLRSDPKTALAEFHTLVDQGSIMSMVFIGRASERGNVTNKDFADAELWFRRAADRGSLKGHYFLAVLYLKQKRFEEAAAALQYAAEMRYVPALHLLGAMYLKGEGVPLDLKKGERLLERASAAGSVFAKARLAHSFMYGHFGTSKILVGLRLQIEAIFQFVSVLFTEGFESERLR